MTDLIIRNVPDEVIAEIEAQAEKANQSRQQYLLTRLTELSEVGWQPSRPGEGIKCFSPAGGEVTLKRLVESVQTGAKNLTQAEYKAFQRAKLLADPRNGGKWSEARKILEDAGFEIFNI